jgi:hypothetical protein
MLSLSFDFNIHMEHKCCSTASIIMSAVKMKAKLPQGNCSRRIQFVWLVPLLQYGWRGLQTPLALGTVEKRLPVERKLSAFTANCYKFFYKQINIFCPMPYFKHPRLAPSC